jgi:hypothetical protein
VADYPYVRIVLMIDLAANDEEGFTHIPIAIESTPGIDVEKILRYSLESYIRDKEESEREQGEE